MKINLFMFVLGFCIGGGIVWMFQAIKHAKRLIKAQRILADMKKSGGVIVDPKAIKNGLRKQQAQLIKNAVKEYKDKNNGK